MDFTAVRQSVADLDLSFHLFRSRATKRARARNPVEIWILYL